MVRTSSFQDNKPTLYLVATPIGNLEEMSERAKRILREVDYIGAEDTRNTGILLKHFSIEGKMFSSHQHNEKESIQKILSWLSEGKSIALVSDAGYPVISDPGEGVVSKVIEEGYPVVVVNGPSAGIMALVASGLKTQPYLFYGFLPSKKNERKKELEKYKGYEETLIFYEAPHRIRGMLEDVLEVFGDRKMCLGRELTKLHEEYIRGKVSEVIEVCDELKGEMVVVMDGNHQEKTVSLEFLQEIVKEKVKEGMKISEAIKVVAKEYQVKKNELYESMMKEE